MPKHSSALDLLLFELSNSDGKEVLSVPAIFTCTIGYWEKVTLGMILC